MTTGKYVDNIMDYVMISIIRAYLKKLWNMPR